MEETRRRLEGGVKKTEAGVEPAKGTTHAP